MKKLLLIFGLLIIFIFPIVVKPEEKIEEENIADNAELLEDDEKPTIISDEKIYEEVKEEPQLEKAKKNEEEQEVEKNIVKVIRDRYEPQEAENVEKKAGTSTKEDEFSAISEEKETKDDIEVKDEEDIFKVDEELKDLEKKVSLKDKAKAVKLILSKLSKDDIIFLKGLMKGGLSPDEKKEAVEIAYSKYNEEELEIIKEFYHKYMGN